MYVVLIDVLMQKKSLTTHSILGTFHFIVEKDDMGLWIQ